MATSRRKQGDRRAEMMERVPAARAILVDTLHRDRDVDRVAELMAFMEMFHGRRMTRCQAEALLRREKREMSNEG